MNMLLALTRPPFNLQRRDIFIGIGEIRLWCSQLGDEDLKTFADALGKGALPQLQFLYLYKNNIGDEGMKAFAEAIGKGALATTAINSTDTKIAEKLTYQATAEALTIIDCLTVTCCRRWHGCLDIVLCRRR